MPNDAPHGPPPRRDEPPRYTDLRGVLKEEHKALAARRTRAYGNACGADEVAEDVVGLSLSGGGIRSATFNLGLIQAFHATGLLKHIDYLVTISGGGYIGANLTRLAAQAGAGARGSNGRPADATGAPGPDKPAAPPGEDVGAPPDDWFPYPVGKDGRQDRRLLNFYKRGDYLDRPFQLGFTWLPGTMLNVLMLVSGLVAVCSMVAYAMRVVDLVWFDQILQRVCRWVLLQLHGAGDFLDKKVSFGARARILNWHVPSLLVAVVLVLVPLLLRWMGREPKGPVGIDLKRSRRRQVYRRLGRVMFWPVVFLCLIGWGILRLDWPTEGQAQNVVARLTQKSRDDMKQTAEGLFLAERYKAGRYQDRWAPPAYAKRAFADAQDMADYLLNLLSGDEDRMRWALGRLDSRARSKAVQRGTERAQKGVNYDELDADQTWSTALCRYSSVASELVAADKNVPEEARPAPRSDRSWGPTTDGFTPAQLYEIQVYSRASELTDLIVTDLFRAMLPALVLTLVYTGYRAYQMVRGEGPRRPGDRRGRLSRFCWLLLGLGLIIALVNGDTDIGFLKFFVPSVPGFEAVNEESGVVSGARMTLTGTLSMFRSMVFTVPTFIAAAFALIPVVSRNKFLESAEQPKDSFRGKFYRVIVGSIVVILPITCFGFLARENVSGAAPVANSGDAAPDPAQGAAKDDNGSAQGAGGQKTSAAPVPADGKGRLQIARMAFCPNSRFGPRHYLIENDQQARLLIGAASLSTFLFLAWIVNLNNTSIHMFYKDRLYEAYLADKPREPRVRHKLCDLDGTRVGFPYHIIATTLNQFHAPDDLKDNQHSFILSRLYCGSEPSGYRRTDDYANGVDLADAMAVSGAAISPVQARSGVTRLIMLILNMRLGQWYPNPRPDFEPSRRVRPNLIHLLADHWYLTGLPGARFLWPKDRLRSEEPRAYCFLSDGAHFDNLGIDLLLQRRCRLMIVSDVSHDPDFACEELIAAFRKARARTGVDFEPLWMTDVRSRLGVDKREIAPRPDPSADPFRFRSTADSPAAKARIADRLVRENFLVGRITYPPDPENPSANRDGLLVLIKPSLTAELVDRPEVCQYVQSNANFPHDSDMEQVFDEARVEAYRQLGQCVGETLAEVTSLGGEGSEKSRGHLRRVIDTLLAAKGATTLDSFGEEAGPRSKDPADQTRTVAIEAV